MSDQLVSAPSNFKYDAFISYRRSDGSMAARWLRTRLQTYSLPKPLRGESPKKLKVYLDTVYERATEDFFEENIEPALTQSRFLIVVSTPDALRPRPAGTPNWVHREVETFAVLPQGRNIVVALAEGEMDHPLPGGLTKKFPRIEIVDFREFGLSRFIWLPKRWRLHEELLKIVAPLFDVPTESMPLLRLEESRRRQRNLWLTLVSSFALFAAMTGLFIWAFINLASARQQLIRMHLLQGQDLFAHSPAFARLHFAKAVEVADSSTAVGLVSWAEDVGLLDLGLRNDCKKARLWLGQWKDRPPPQVVWHQLNVRAVDFSPDGRRFVTVSMDGEAQVWSAETGQPIGQRMSGWAYASLVKFSPNGRRIIVLSTTTFVTQLWDVDTGQAVGQEMAHPGPVTSASFSPDGRVLATSSGLGQIFFWNAETANPAGEPLKAGDDVREISFSPDGTLLAVTTSDLNVRVWEVAARRPVGKKFRPHSARPTGIYLTSFNADSHRLLVALDDNTAQMLDVRTSKLLGAPLTQGGGIASAAFSPDGRRIVTAGFNGTAQVWDAETGVSVGLPLRHDGPIESAAFSADSRLVVTASRDFTARAWEAETGAPYGGIMQHANVVNGAAFSPDAKRVATVSDDRTARLWELETGPRYIDMGGANITFAAPSEDGAHLLTIGADKTLRVWNWPAGTPAGRDGQEVRDVEAARLGLGGRQIWLKNIRNEFYAWEYESGEMRRMLSVGREELKEAQFSPDGRHIITTGIDNVVKLWDAATGAAVGNALQLKDGSAFYASSANGELLILNDEEGRSVEVWSMVEAKALSTPLIYEGKLQDVTCTPDGTRVWLVTKDEKKNVTQIMWDPEGGKSTRRGLPGDVTFGAISTDGRRIATKDYNYSAQVWDAVTGEPVGKVLRHGTIINDVAFSTDGGLVLTVSGREAQMWDAATGDIIGEPLNLDDTITSPSFFRDGQHLIIAAGHKVFGWDFSTDDASAEMLRLKAEVATVFTIDVSGSVRMLTEEEWRRLQEHLLGTRGE